MATNGMTEGSGAQLFNWWCPACKMWLPTHEQEMDERRRHIKCKTKAVWRRYELCIQVPCPNKEMSDG